MSRVWYPGVVQQMSESEYPELFHRLPTPRERLRSLLDYAILAPSTHNTQPWRFRLHDEFVEVWADRERCLPTIDPDGRQQHMSCGAALLNIEVALRRCGYSAETQLLPSDREPGLLARVMVGSPRPIEKEDLDLFNAIPWRRTNRARFASRPIGDALAAELTQRATTRETWMFRFLPEHKHVLSELVAECDLRLGASPAYREEVARWLVPAGSSRRDGVPMRKRNVATTLPVAGTLLVRKLDRGRKVAEHERKLIVDSPLVAALGTISDSPRAWVQAGMALQAVMLAATHYGIGVSFLNQAVELSDLRTRLAELCEPPGIPQLVLRMGYGPPMPPTPRRPLADVVEG